jgi:hypothetical protein
MLDGSGFWLHPAFFSGATMITDVDTTELIAVKYRSHELLNYYQVLKSFVSDQTDG